MLLIIDNYDSFTYNLYQYLGELGAEMKVFRNDKVTIKEIEAMSPSHLVVSPGPKRPENAGISMDAISAFSGRIPILGVCLGHQSVCQVYGSEVVRAERLMHGKTSMVHHNGTGVFAGLPEPFEATRYHSLIVKKSTLADCFDICAWTDSDEIMGVRHKSLQIYGVQFHPESILTNAGKKLLQNFLATSCQPE